MKKAKKKKTETEAFDPTAIPYELVLLERNVGVVQALYRTAIESGTERPVIFIALRDAPERFTAWAIPYEKALKEAAEMSANGPYLLERVASVPDAFPAIAITRVGPCYVPVPKAGEFQAKPVTPFDKVQ